MKKIRTAVSLTIACTAAFALISCGNTAKFKEVQAEAQETTYTAYQTKYNAALDNVLYVKDYVSASANMNATVDSQNAKMEMTFTTDGDYAWTKNDASKTLSAMALKTNISLKTQAAQQTLDMNFKTESYLNEEGLFTKANASGIEQKSFVPLSDVGETEYGGLEAENAFEMFSDLFAGSYGELKEAESFKMYSYSESSGSGFRLTYSETFDSGWTGGGIEGLEEILELLGNENASLSVETTLSIYFDANNKLTGTEATLNIVLSSQDSSTPADGSVKFYQKTTVESSSTVKYPSDLDSYKSAE